MQNAAKENAHFCQQLFIKHVTSRKLHTVLRAGLSRLLRAASRGSCLPCSPGASEEGKAHSLLPTLVFLCACSSCTMGCQHIWVWQERGDALLPARAWQGEIAPSLPVAAGWWSLWSCSNSLISRFMAARAGGQPSRPGPAVQALCSR